MPDDGGGSEGVNDNFKCATCGKIHPELPRSFAADFPDMYANMKREEQDARAIIGSDQCVVDQQWFFIRGCLEIPVVGSAEPFLWGLWASVHQDVFDEISESWEEEGREKTHGPFKGRLANSLSVYVETLNVKVRILIQPVATRPLFIVEQPEHPLAIEQQNGVSEERAKVIASLLLHQERFGWPAKFT
ncbi:MAG: DUF2199 domain-containing protein [Terriglobales bacterium]